jgi:hypothetical protein
MIVASEDQRRQDFLIIRQRHRIVRANHQYTIVSLRQILLKQSDRFSKHSLNAVAANRRAHPTRHAQPPSAMRKLVGFGIRHQRRAALFGARGINGREGQFPAQPVVPWKFILFCRHKCPSNPPEDIAEWPHHAMLTLPICLRGAPHRPWHGICTILRRNMNAEAW